MRETRRSFLMALAAGIGCAVAADAIVLAQSHKRNPFPTPPQPAEQGNPAQAAEPDSDSRNARRMRLLQNEKEFRAEVERLYQLASELKKEVDQTPTTEVFSVQMYKRAEEVEKLAKQLKAKAKGR